METKEGRGEVLNLCGLLLQDDGLASLELLESARETLTELNLSHNELTTLPPILFSLPSLTKLVRDSFPLILVCNQNNNLPLLTSTAGFEF
jgi:Leucine-rich repeat (LRR) protein